MAVCGSRAAASRRIEPTDAGAEFVTVGGHTVAFHGYPRAMKDLDILVIDAPPVSISQPLALLGNLRGEPPYSQEDARAYAEYPFDVFRCVGHQFGGMILSHGPQVASSAWISNRPAEPIVCAIKSRSSRSTSPVATASCPNAPRRDQSNGALLTSVGSAL